MKIQGNNRLTGVNPYQKLNTPGVEKAKKTATSKADEVQISSEAKEMLNIQKTDHTDRKARIQELKAQIESGTYKVDSRLLADKLYDVLKGNKDV